MILTGLASFFVLFRSEVAHAGIGLGSLVLLLMYVFGMRLVFRQEDVKRRQREHQLVAKAEAEAADVVGRAGRRGALRQAALGLWLLFR